MKYINAAEWGLLLLTSLAMGCGRPARIQPPTPRQADRLWVFNLEPGVQDQANNAIRAGQVLVLKKEAQEVRILQDCFFSGKLRPPQLTPWSETHLISTHIQAEASFQGNATLIAKASAKIEQGEGLKLRLISVASYSSSVAGGKPVSWGDLRAQKPYGCDGATHLSAILHLGAAQLTTTSQQGGAISVGPVALGTSGAAVLDERVGEPDLCQGGFHQDPRCQLFVAMDLIAISGRPPSSKVDRQACDERDAQACYQRCQAGLGDACNNAGYVAEVGGNDAIPKDQRIQIARWFYQKGCQLGSQKGCANELRLQLSLSTNASAKEATRSKLEMYCERGINFACEIAGDEQLKQGEKVVSFEAKPGLLMDPVGAISRFTGAASNAQHGLQLLQRACALGSGEACYKLTQRASLPTQRP